MNQSNPQLVPLVVVDRNGRTTTVYKKPNLPVKHSPFGKPVLPAAKPTDKMTGQEIAYTIIKRLKNATPPEGYPKVRILPNVRNSLVNSAADREHIRKVHAVFETLLAGEAAENFQAVHTIVSDVDLENPVDVKALHTNLEYVMQRPDLITDITLLGRLLVRYGITDPDSDTPFVSLPAHLEARSHHRRLHAASHGYYSGDRFADYRNNPSYMAAVERHHDKLEHLFAYRELRGVSGDSFDEQDFQNYLSHGAVANGWL